MKTHFLSLILFAMILASSCSQEEIVQQQTVSLSDCKFVASFEQNESRTYLEDGKYLRWTANDELSIFMGKTLNRQFRFTGETGDNSGGFEEASSPGFVTGNDLDNPCHYAIYPYAKGTKITETGVLTVNLPSEQTYEENSFGCGANTMVAVTSSLSDMELSFKNACGYLKFKLYGDDVTVKSVALQSNGEEKLSGSATLIAANDKNPSITMSSTASDMITLDCGTGVKIGSTSETATEFWFVVPPTTFESGFTVIIKDVNDNEFTKSTSKKISIERNIIKPISAFEVQPQIQTKEIPYLTFTADAEQTLTMSKAVATLEYSVDGEEWEELGTTTVTFGGNNGNLRLRGKSSIGTSAAVQDYNNYSTIIFGNNTPVACTGDIRTLIDYENYTTAKTENARFRNLFKNCTSLTTAPDLPAEVLADFCYGNMFVGCKSLIEAPQLPAKTIPSGGYYHMFEGCNSLIKAPELPAMTVGNAAYNTMFAGCTSLIDAPELPATTLEGENHYACMFMNCTSLKNIPTILPSMIATSNCYANMFDGCVSITTAPALPATTVSLWCYDDMFKGCISLINAPEELPATELAPQCYPNMFSGCENLKKAPKLPATKLTEQCYSGMFSGCTNLETAPELPATELATTCYSSMFAGCTSLEVSPKLIASKLEPSCYNRMFFGCSKLNKIFMYATDISASFCLEHWVEGVSSTGTFYKASAMKSLVQDNYDYDGIPIGDWTVKNYDTNNGGALDKSVTISKAGTLSQIITDEEKYEIKSLTITGELNGDDILYLREMAGVDVKGYSTGGVLTNLDIKNATIVEGGGYYFAFETSSLNAFYTKTSQISDYMFYGTKLEEIILPLNTTSIGPSSFSACYKLKGMSIPLNVVAIEENAFGGCSNLTSIEIPYGVTTIGYAAFQNCTGLTSIKLSETVNTISTSAFSGCSNLTSIEIPYGVTTIGPRAFQNCTGLTSIKLSETVNSISSSAFNGIHSLAFEVADNNNTYSAINGVLFSKDRTALIKYCLDKTNPNYTIPNTTISIGDDAFYNSEISEIILPNSVETIGKSSFSSCSKLTSVTLNEGLKEIGSGAFSQCNSLKTITIPNYVTSLTATFSNNKGITSVTLSEKLEVLGAFTFNGCSNMVSIKLPESLLEIGEFAFKGTGLTTVTIPENVKTIDGTAFNDTNITELHFKGTTPPEQGLFIFNYEFQNNCTLYVPKGSINTYRNSTVWKYFKTIIEE